MFVQHTEVWSKMLTSVKESERKKINEQISYVIVGEKNKNCQFRRHLSPYSSSLFFIQTLLLDRDENLVSHTCMFVRAYEQLS